MATLLTTQEKLEYVKNNDMSGYLKIKKVIDTAFIKASENESLAKELNL